VLVAADDREPAFDNAVDALADRLASFGVPRGNVAKLKATARGEAAAGARNLRRAFRAMAPAPGEGCFLFVTSHGIQGRGLFLRRERAFLGPAALGRLLAESCGARPTVAVLSGCFSGLYARELAAPNRVVLTAARDDRPSFGCDAGRRFTIFDECLLASLEKGAPWAAVMDKARECVAGNEARLGVAAPSGPQLSVGAEAAGLVAFGG
jgi:hypothetical protein